MCIFVSGKKHKVLKARGGKLATAECEVAMAAVTL